MKERTERERRKIAETPQATQVRQASGSGGGEYFWDLGRMGGVGAGWRDG